MFVMTDDANELLNIIEERFPQYEMIYFTDQHAFRHSATIGKIRVTRYLNNLARYMLTEDQQNN